MAKFQLLDNEEIPTRKISVGFIKPPGKLHDIHIYRYFRKYGSISSTFIKRANTLNYIAIQYKHSASVTALLAKGKQNINGLMCEPQAVYVSLTIADLLNSIKNTTKNKRENIDDHTSPASDEDLSSNIMNKLNDDCLMEIFERAPLGDLCAIANTCIRFNENVKKVFAARFTNIDVVWLKDDDLSNEPIPMVLIASLFRNFGMFIKTVAINLNDVGRERNDRVLSLILKYCKLSGLKISNFKFDSNLMDEFRPIFARLTHLSISEMDATNLKRLLSMCKSLTHLQLEAIDFGRTHKQIFQQLEDIELICVSELNNDKLKKLISMNQKIKRLVICDPFNQLSSVAYQSIGRLPLLEHIEVEPAIPTPEKDSEQNVLALAQLKHLKVFRLNCLATPINELLNSFAKEKLSIHDLSLKGLVLDSKNTQSISKMADIRTLRLLEPRGSDISHFMEMVTKMPYLQHLVFGGNSSSQLSIKNITKLVAAVPDLSKFCLINQKYMAIDLDDYNKMLGLIKERRSSIGLNIKILGMELNMVVPDYIVKRNHQWLNVKIKNIDMEIDSEEQDEDDDDDYNDIDAIELFMMFRMLVSNL